MVNDKGDLPDEEDVAPTARFSNTVVGFLQEVVETGEATVYLAGGTTEELHNYDTYFFADRLGDSAEVIYTKNDDEDDVWIFPEQITKVERH